LIYISGKQILDVFFDLLEIKGASYVISGYHDTFVFNTDEVSDDT